MDGIAEPIFGNWYIDGEHIGEGSFGRVYKIKREDFGKTYYSALKVIQIPQNKDEIKTTLNELGDIKSVSNYYAGFVQDFAKEIELMAELKGNSNIVSFEDHRFIRNSDGISWTILIRMELLTPLTDYQAAHGMQTKDIVKLGIDLCSALELCERRNIIHRDIKPANIFVSRDGQFKLGDFGIARELEKTMAGLSKKGTYSYMAPEVYRGEVYNQSVDIYSLGIVLYKFLNRNRLPFYPDASKPVTHSDSEAALMRRMRGEGIPEISRISPALNAVILKACSFNPNNRFQTAAQMKENLISISERGLFTSNDNGTLPFVAAAAAAGVAAGAGRPELEKTASMYNNRQRANRGAAGQQYGGVMAGLKQGEQDNVNLYNGKGSYYGPAAVKDEKTPRKKGSSTGKILAIVLAVIFAVGAGVFAYLYFGTDLMENKTVAAEEKDYRDEWVYDQMDYVYYNSRGEQEWKVIFGKDEVQVDISREKLEDSGTLPINGANAMHFSSNGDVEYTYYFKVNKDDFYLEGVKIISDDCCSSFIENYTELKENISPGFENVNCIYDETYVFANRSYFFDNLLKEDVDFSYIKQVQFYYSNASDNCTVVYTEDAKNYTIYNDKDEPTYSTENNKY